LNHHVDEWKSNHITLLVQVFTLTSGDCFPGVFASLPNVSSWPMAAVCGQPLQRLNAAPGGCRSSGGLHGSHSA